LWAGTNINADGKYLKIFKKRAFLLIAGYLIPLYITTELINYFHQFCIDLTGGKHESIV
jgi:hypothetical protein